MAFRGEADSTKSELASSAWADGPTAAAEATAAAVAGLAGAPPSLVLLFPDVQSSVAQAVGEARRAAPGCHVAGMSSRGVLSLDGSHTGGCSATAFGPGVEVGLGFAGRASEDPREAGRAAAAMATEGLTLVPGHAVLLLFIDPTSGDESAAIDGAYSVVGGRVPLAGGGANGPNPLLIADDFQGEDAVVAVAVCSPAPVAVGVAHGCRPVSEPAIATRTEGRALRELNGRPAEEVYLEGLGRSAPLDDGAFETFAVLHPLGQPELRGQLRLRHVLGRAEGGGLECAAAIPANAAVWFTEQTRETIVASAVRAVHETLARLPAPPRAGLIFDCAARRRALGGGVAEEGRALSSAFGDVTSLSGLYTRGEVGRVRGAKGDRNHAIVVVAFG